MSKKAILSLLIGLALLSNSKAEAKSLYTKQNQEYLSKIIAHEAGADYCSDYTRFMVGVVVLKRVKSPLFPNTVKGVLLQPRQYMSQWEFDRTIPNKKSKRTAKKLLKGGFKGVNAYPDNLVYHANFIQGSGVYRVSNGIYFCLH